MSVQWRGGLGAKEARAELIFHSLRVTLRLRLIAVMGGEKNGSVNKDCVLPVALSSCPGPRASATMMDPMMGERQGGAEPEWWLETHTDGEQGDCWQKNGKL